MTVVQTHCDILLKTFQNIDITKRGWYYISVEPSPLQDNSIVAFRHEHIQTRKSNARSYFCANMEADYSETKYVTPCFYVLYHNQTIPLETLLQFSIFSLPAFEASFNLIIRLHALFVDVPIAEIRTANVFSSSFNVVAEKAVTLHNVALPAFQPFSETFNSAFFASLRSLVVWYPMAELSSVNAKQSGQDEVCGSLKNCYEQDVLQQLCQYNNHLHTSVFNSSFSATSDAHGCSEAFPKMCNVQRSPGFSQSFTIQDTVTHTTTRQDTKNNTLILYNNYAYQQFFTLTETHLDEHSRELSNGNSIEADSHIAPIDMQSFAAPPSQSYNRETLQRKSCPSCLNHTDSNIFTSKKENKLDGAVSFSASHILTRENHCTIANYTPIKQLVMADRPAELSKLEHIKDALKASYPQVHAESFLLPSNRDNVADTDLLDTHSPGEILHAVDDGFIPCHASVDSLIVPMELKRTYNTVESQDTKLQNICVGVTESVASSESLATNSSLSILQHSHLSSSYGNSVHFPLSNRHTVALTATIDGSPVSACYVARCASYHSKQHAPQYNSLTELYLRTSLLYLHSMFCSHGITEQQVSDMCIPDNFYSNTYLRWLLAKLVDGLLNITDSLLCKLIAISIREDWSAFYRSFLHGVDEESLKSLLQGPKNKASKRQSNEFNLDMTRSEFMKKKQRALRKSLMKVERYFPECLLSHQSIKNGSSSLTNLLAAQYDGLIKGNDFRDAPRMLQSITRALRKSHLCITPNVPHSIAYGVTTSLLSSNGYQILSEGIEPDPPEEVETLDKPSLHASVESLQSCSKNISKLVEVSSEGRDLYVLVHGYRGNELDLRLFRNHLKEYYISKTRGVTDNASTQKERPHSGFYSTMPVIIVSKINACEKSTDSILILAERLALEIVTELATWCRKTIRRIHFIGHSLGCIIIEACLLTKAFEPHLSHLGKLMCINGPLTGGRSIYSLVNFGYSLIAIFHRHKSIRELLLSKLSPRNTKQHVSNYSFLEHYYSSRRKYSDRPRSLLGAMAEASMLKLFEEVILLGSPQDGFSKLHSSIGIPDMLLRGRSYKEEKAILKKFCNIPKLRVIVMVYNPHIIGAAGTLFDTRIGRIPHVLPLNDDQVVSTALSYMLD